MAVDSAIGIGATSGIFKPNGSTIREPKPDWLQRKPPPGANGEHEIPFENSGPTIHVDGVTGAASMTDEHGTHFIATGGAEDLPGERAEHQSGGFDENLAERPDVPLATISQRLLDHIMNGDIPARSEWEEMGNKGTLLLGLKWEDASSQVGPEGTVSRTHHPMLLWAVLQSWASARAELLPASGPVKVRDDMPSDVPSQQVPQGNAPGIAPAPPPAANMNGAGIAPTPPPGGNDVASLGVQPPKRLRSEKADALEKDMNHYLTKVDREYYPDTSAMLVTRAVKGSQFKKVYYDPLLRRPISRWVKGTDLIISNDAKHLSGATRVTERIPTRQGTVKRMQRAKVWRKVHLAAPANTPTSTEQAEQETSGIVARPQLPADHLHEIFECYTELDDGPLGCDETGADQEMPLPYRVTIDKDSREILEIRRNWKEGDADFRARRRYVHFGMVPGLTFYHWGLVHLLSNPQRAATALLREFIDSEMLASFPGGVMRKSATTKNQSTEIRVGPSQFQVIDTGGEPLRDWIMPWVYKGASPQLGAVLQTIVEEGRKLVGALEMPVGEGRVGDVPVGTIMAYIDSVSKVPSAVHKDDHAAQSEEFELLKELFEEYPDALESAEERKWTKDELEDQELVPAADPNTPSSVHRIMQGSALVQLATIPALMMAGIPNARAIWKRCLQILGIEDIDSLTNPEPPPGSQQQPPDPKAIADAAKAQNDAEKLKLEAAKLQQKGTEIQRQAASDAVEAEQREQDRNAEQTLENTRLQIERERLTAEQTRAHADANQEHAREVGATVLGHAADHRDAMLQHQQHTETLAQEDRHHADDLAEGAAQRQHDAAQGDEDRKAAAKKPAAKPKPKGKGK